MKKQLFKFCAMVMSIIALGSTVGCGSKNNFGTADKLSLCKQFCPFVNFSFVEILRHHHFYFLRIYVPITEMGIFMISRTAEKLGY